MPLGARHFEAILLGRRCGSAWVAYRVHVHAVVTCRSHNHTITACRVYVHPVRVCPTHIEAMPLGASHLEAILERRRRGSAWAACRSHNYTVITRREYGIAVVACCVYVDAVVACRVHAHAVAGCRGDSQARACSVAQHQGCIVGITVRTCKSEGVGAAAARPGLAQVVVTVVAGPRTALAPVAGCQLNIEDVHVAVVVHVAGRVVGSARRAGGGSGSCRRVLRVDNACGQDGNCRHHRQYQG